MKKYLDKLQNMPIGISGTCLAFITLSNSWNLKGINYFKPIAIFLAVCMLFLMILRLIRFPKVMYEELKNPVTGTFYPTMGMVVWLVSGFFYPYFPVVCSWLWIAAVIYHYGIVIFYTIIRIKERKFENIMPTCFIVYTGMITGSVASKGMDGVIPQIPQIAHFMLMFGFIFYTILLPLVLYIVFKSEILDDHKLPTVGIICSPAPLGVVGILTIEPNPNPYMLAWLIITGLILLVVVYGYILKLFKEGFKPSYAAFTFPLAIATLSAFKLSTYFTGLGYAKMANLFKFLGDVEIFIATYVIFFMLLNFLNMFFKAISPKLGEYVEEEEELIGGTLYSK
ncbi:TDT family transporter [Clostridium perfringens]|nr:TDT family transporter [Clostridium perfringens]AQW25439.1 C4-dicarboxylate ABC transporter [Clostridium perfringens]KAB8119519.1 TDT family transporter [Clostridium perfringens]KQC94093.1 C4-dicarboxylate ABC transporter [Clostridium perfringens CP4]MBO3338566.1 TDT family transporter [Clostridium perfringens]MBO3386114.1 TDT family transporter [Clostridium perfringens]